jgi:anti-sigma-K factor RskA
MMNTHESDFDCRQLPDAAAYVLGSLEDDEAVRFREHLRSCPQCRAEVAELQPVVDELPLKVAREDAPDALRKRILATVRSEAAILHAAGHEADEAPRPRRSWSSLLGSPIGLAATAAAAAVIALAVVLASGSGGHDKVFPGRVSASAIGASATLQQHDGRAELTVSHMPKPGLGRIYEVWLSRGKGNAEPTNALFSVSATGDGETDVPSNLHGIREVMVTSEPAGGSLHPTRQPVIQIPLDS